MVDKSEPDLVRTGSGSDRVLFNVSDTQLDPVATAPGTDNESK